MSESRDHAYERLDEGMAEEPAPASPAPASIVDPVALTPPTATRKPPTIGSTSATFRTSVYIDALEQLKDEEVLSDAFESTRRQRSRGGGRGSKSGVGSLVASSADSGKVDLAATGVAQDSSSLATSGRLQDAGSPATPSW